MIANQGIRPWTLRDPDHSRYDPLPWWKTRLSFTARYLIVQALDRKNWPPNKRANWGGLPAVETPSYPPPFTWLSFWSRHGGRHGDSCRACLRWSFYWQNSGKNLNGGTHYCTTIR